MNKLTTYIAAPLLAIAALATTGCGDEGDEFSEEFAEAYCNRKFTCDAARTTWPDKDACVEGVIAQFEAETVEQRAKGREYDSGCASIELSKLEAFTCEPTFDPDAPTPACQAPCHVWYGDLGLGVSCGSGTGTCGQGLSCNTTFDSEGNYPESAVCSNPCDAQDSGYY